jgi:hypothetical protein
VQDYLPYALVYQVATTLALKLAFREKLLFATKKTVST